MRLISVFQSPLVEFLCDARYAGVAPEPVPASKSIPEWFKRIPPYSKKNRDRNDRPAMTAKKCMPMIDAMSVGFTIPLAIDQHIRSNYDCSQITVGPTSCAFDRAVERHSLDQVGDQTQVFGKADPLKFINPWVIKTPPGWSALFVPPINAMDDRFICLGGLVDTDKYPKQVNLPARWLKPNYDDTLPAGTPLVTVIPVRRSDMQIRHAVRQLTDAESREIDRIHRCQDSRNHYYSDELRCPR